jgi:hypothetical protein
MLRKFTKKRALIVASIAVVAVAAVAYAFFSADGTGSGTGTTAGAPSDVTVNQSTVVSNLYPGATPTALSGTFDNPNSGAVHVNGVTATIDSVDDTHETAGCEADDYVIGGAGVVGNSGNVPSGDDQGSWSGLTVQLSDTGQNQDDCQGATVNISYGTN